MGRRRDSRVQGFKDSSDFFLMISSVLKGDFQSFEVYFSTHELEIPNGITSFH
jgi:hypothetical protein